MKVVKLYVKGGGVVRDVLMDGEFEIVKTEISFVDINISAVHEYVAET